MIFKMALKNITANKLRSTMIFLLSGISAAFLVFYVGLMEGSHRKMMKDSVEMYGGYIQIQYQGYKDNSDYDHFVYDSEKVIEMLPEISGVKNFGERLETYALLSSENNTTPAMFSAVEFKKEAEISKIKSFLVKGEYPDDDSEKALIGIELANKLGVDVGDKISYVSTGLDFSIAADYIVIGGIFKSGYFDFDSSSVFVSKKYADKAFSSEGIASYIVVQPKDTKNLEALRLDIIKSLNNNELEVFTWRDLQEELVKAVQIDSIFGYISIGIFFIVIFFVIMLFNLAAVMTRTREIGVLKAIGTSSGTIFLTLLAEGFFSGIFTVLFGGAAGCSVTYYFELHPIQIGGYGEAYKDLGLNFTEIPSVLSWELVAVSLFFVFVLNIFSVLYPALKVNKLKPVDAIRSF